MYMSFCFLYFVFCTVCCEFYVHEFCSCWLAIIQVILNLNKTLKKLFSVQVLENCNYAVELGKKLNFVLVGIGGELFRPSTPAPLGGGDFKKQFSNRSQISGKFTPLATTNCGLQRVEECSYHTLLFQQNPSVKGQCHQIFYSGCLPDYRIFVISNFMENMWR
jgi:hypothetical protein